MKVEAALFDIDGTLLSGRRGVVESSMEGLKTAHVILRAGGVPLPDFRTTFSLIQRELTRSAASLSFGNFREADLPKMVRDFVDRAFPGTPEKVLEEALEAWYEPSAALTVAVPGALEALKELKDRGIMTAAAGNSPWGEGYIRKDLDRAALLPLIDAVVCSADVGYRKPNVFLIRRALELLGCPGEKAIHVGDDPREDVETPQEMGMIAVLIGPPDPSSRADVVIPDLESLAAAVDSLSAR